jgi:hypothetical protein
MHETQGVPMSLTLILFAMIAARMVAALAMLWGVLRIACRHHPVAQIETDSTGRSETPHLSAAS